MSKELNENHLSDAAYEKAKSIVATARAKQSSTLRLVDLKYLDRLPPLDGLAVTKVELSGSGVRDLSGLVQLGGLEDLDFHDASRVQDIQVIQKLIHLRALTLFGLPEDVDLAPIGKLEGLRELAIGYTPIVDIAFIAGLKNLTLLTLSKTLVGDISPIAGLRSLRSLGLGETQVSDLSGIGGLENLTHLHLWNLKKLVDISPLAKLRNLTNLDLSGSGVSDLSPLSHLTKLRSLHLDQTPISGLTALARLRSLVNSKGVLPGLSFRKCRRLDPNLREIAERENPKRTIDAINYARDQLGLKPFKVRSPTKKGFPAVPHQGAGPHFAVGDDGLIDFAPPGTIDEKGNNLARLRALLPTLTELAKSLLDELGGGNIAHGALHDRLRAYVSLIDQDLDGISFDRVYVEGVRLQNAFDAAKEKIAENELPSFGARVIEPFNSLLKLHGTFMLATASGMEMIAAEERYQRRPKEEKELREASEAFAAELQNRPDIIAPGAADFIARAAKDIGRGANVERSSVIGAATTKNATIVVLTGAAIGSLPIVGSVVGGSLGIVGGGLAALVGVEGLKRSKSFLAISGLVTKRLDKLSDSEFEKIVADRAGGLSPISEFVIKSDRVLRRFGRASHLPWVAQLIDWLKSQRGNDR